MIKILQLAPDCMNLYGDRGNLLILTAKLKAADYAYQVDSATIGDALECLSTYDFIYMGAGSEYSQKLVLAWLSPYKSLLEEAISSDKVILFTGNSFELLGEEIVGCDRKTYEGLGIFPFHVFEHASKRESFDAVLSSDHFAEKTIGYVNKCSAIDDLPSPLFKNDRYVDGLQKNNFYATSLIGPVLVKNPHVLKKLLSLLGTDPSKMDFSLEEKAYEIALAELNKTTNGH